MTTIRGLIKRGRGIGRKLGFPTVNLRYDGDLEGVFAAHCVVKGHQFGAAVHLGARPTFADEEKICEAFILDFDGHLDEGLEVEIIPIKKIREVKKFDSIDELIAQIEKDVQYIRELL